MTPKAKRRKRRVVIDTSVLVAGIAGFREPYRKGRNPSADLLHTWAEEDTLLWLYSEEILAEYKHVLRRLRVRPHVIGAVINLIRERAEKIEVRIHESLSPDPNDDPICQCAETGNADFLVTLNLKDFPQKALTAKVIKPGEIL
ncbi:MULTISPECIES: PIN domain-containing protein [Acidobacterium]|uniref:PIN domain-containing protein n=1 Tax=Acidobacterium TaxID=33973 RepID=UPI0005A01B1A|nr:MULTISPECIES: PIN domain-containing protein [Acidobacterium]